MVGGVSAYSTLVRFADPVLNTMMRWNDDDLVETLFHELAHQLVYVKDDSQFNESFATTVAQTGLERWREHDGEGGLSESWQRRRRESAEFVALAISAREELETLYASGLDESTMREQKQEILHDLANDTKIIADRQDAVANPFGGTLNNARLALINVYEGRVTAFESLLRVCEGNLVCFYREADQLAKLDKAARDRKLDGLAKTVAPDL
jgi:predicted aminopeptidase